MSNVIPFNSPKAKAELKQALAKGQTKAKTSTTPAGKQKIAAAIKRKAQAQAKLTAPGAVARCRHITGGDLRAAVLLYRIVGLWDAIQNKMHLPGSTREYLAMTQADWATAAGLSESELKNYALPILKKYAFPVVQFEVHGRGASKKTWVHFDREAFRAASVEAGYELKVAAAAGQPGYL